MLALDKSSVRIEKPVASILDVCCSGRMFWFDKKQPNTLFVAIDECLTWALKTNEQHGIFGGHTASERAHIRRKIARNRSAP